jgi:ketosteroid isomerase-like protein
MSQQRGKALLVARAYYEAWTSKDLERAMSYVASDIVCDTPACRIEGSEAYRAFMAPFVQILEGADLLAAFGDDNTAVLMYDTKTVPVPSAPGAECITVKDGKIVRSRIVFDRLPFEAARQPAAA